MGCGELLLTKQHSEAFLKIILGNREWRYWLRRPSPVRLKMALASGCEHRSAVYCDVHEQRSAVKLSFADR
jgi:hypothetical protein